MTSQTPSPFRPKKGRVPTLQFCLPAELNIDPGYQRTIDTEQSQRLIRQIAVGWDWDLCQPLVVSRRGADGRLYVIDGQHRLAAAKLRGDVEQLPCVIVSYDSPAQEAANFVALNQQRQKLSRLDIYRAAIASGDVQAAAIDDAIRSAGLRLTGAGNYAHWKPGWINNIGRIETAWRVQGRWPTTEALRILAQAFEGQVLRYAGSILLGIAAVCRAVMGTERETFPAERRDALVRLLRSRGQDGWRRDIALCAAEDNMNFTAASGRVIMRAYREAIEGKPADRRIAPPPAPAMPAQAVAEPAVARNAPPAAPTPARASDSRPTAPVRENSAPRTPAPPKVIPAPRPANTIRQTKVNPGVLLTRRWCEQCEAMVSPTTAAFCKDRFCKGKSA